MISFEQIERDVSVFSDPATQLNSRKTDSRMEVSIVKGGRSRRYLFRSDESYVESLDMGRVHESFVSLLASDEFADLRTFSDTQRRMLLQRRDVSFLPPAGFLNPETDRTPFNQDVARKVFAPRPNVDALHLVLIDGAAGVGKTSLIERAVLERCDSPNLPPILHITSKGRRLSNLPDAIGKTASDADARFRADQVPVLARLGALQIAIDGFDELVQPDGYQNAWGALKDLVRSIGSGGPLILAGRDTFFDQQDVESKFTAFGSRTSLSMIRLSEVSEAVARHWLLGRGWDEVELNGPTTRELLKRGYVRRPFFLSQIAEFPGGFEDLSSEVGTPQHMLISRILQREAGILQGGLPTGKGAAIERALARVCEEVAVDMSEREADSVPLEYLEFVADFEFSEILDQDERSAILRKIGSLALLEVSERDNQRRFPHSEIQNVFFAGAIFRWLTQGELIPALRSVVYGADVIEAFSEVMRMASISEYRAAFGMLDRIRGVEKFSDRVRLNTSALMLASLVRGLDDDELEMRSVEISEVRLFDKVSRVDLSSSLIHRLDARGADLSDVNLSGCQILTLQVDPTTRFGSALPQVSALQVANEGGFQTIHGGDDIASWLTAHSLLADVRYDWEAHRDLPLVKYFDRLCRRFIRQHQIRDSEGDAGHVLLQDPRISDVLEILGDRMKTVQKDVGGSGNMFYQLSEPAELLNPTPGSDAAIIRRSVVDRAVKVCRSLG